MYTKTLKVPKQEFFWLKLQIKGMRLQWRKNTPSELFKKCNYNFRNNSQFLLSYIGYFF